VFYSTQISNLLVARRTAEDQFVGINAGRSSSGIEFTVNYALLKRPASEIDTYFAAF
jgi:iron complex outermembrane receptor protein